MSETERERETCTTALSALGDLSSTIRPTGHEPDTAIDVRLQDFRSLLALLYHNTTKLGIALKPSSPTYQAAVTPAKELAAHIDALASCACSIDREKHGSAFTREIRWAAEEVISALASLVSLYTSTAETSVAGDAHGVSASYLAKTGAVHEAVDRARGVSRTNREAIRKRWEIVLDGVKDCAKEVEEMVEEEQEGREDDAEGLRGDTDREGDNDDWGELGLPSPSLRDAVKASDEEIARLKSAQHLFKLIHALLKRIATVLLEGRDRIIAASSGTWDALLLPADSLLKASDEFVNALYVPQDPSLVSRTLTALTTLTYDVHVSLSLLGLAERPSATVDADCLDAQMKSLGLEHCSVASGTREGLTKDKKWFDACFAQITKVASAVELVPNMPAT